ncbi:MAG: A/G-specific adenine glycosylase [Petrimonas sp.]|jgi:A/G-specific adenine glycosylase|uniref:Adenine DNA glycosylase n=1 Tax=bioreactor metagenome TaxID=1076179 RepID=A0A645D2Z6_9ZZZZ|nr:A/G-specific adenine glycosylase [Petrimonas sp.]NLU30834.1 A/G-specific adenine glycosylase [Bacteroidales bacterium]HAC72586.1 A/G-specific adenine glycosylase [Porphyromonadaceae bacterium]MDD2910095.1 A/G-specific adenine glycosylase [Petrimonas sp.]MDD3542822.1 A/G-specific adenine glycosylase [Petrimonas sp.]
MRKKESDKLISNILQEWYECHRRILPWRDSKDPYVVWVSEVILQQTRVSQGYDYFLRFMEKFPDIKSLARAQEDDVLKAWQGLGYYSRARNLHAAARQVMEKFDGVFPSSHNDILLLKGVGEYTAAAVASIVFGLPYPVVDGNVYRVLSRLFAIEEPIDSTSGKKLFTETATSILDQQDPGNHNQAIMELGALICTPRLPKCQDCPLQSVCLAFERKNMSDFPVKKGKTIPKIRYFNYFHIEQNGYTYIQKREHSDIWKNLYEFPLIETEKQSDLFMLQDHPGLSTLFQAADEIFLQHKLRLRHVLSHQIILADFYRVEFSKQEMSGLEKKFIKIPATSISEYPVSRLIHKYLETIYR